MVTLKSRIPEITVEMQGKLEAVVRAGAASIAAGAKARVPVDDGDLQAAIHTETEPEGTYVIAGDSDVFWGNFVENGTVKTSPQPFLVPAAEAARESIAVAATHVLRNL